MEQPSEYITDPARLAALRQTALLDSPPEESFDRLTRLATTILGVPISLVSLVDRDRQFFKSTAGLAGALAGTRQTPLSHSFCRHVVLSGEPLIVNDAREHPVLKDNPVVPMGVIAYAGIPLVTPDGFVLGSFCAIDDKPHDWTAEQVELLRDVTASVMTEIELRRTNAELRRANEAKDRFMAMLSHDLRTPLSPALMTATELARDPSLSDEAREDVLLIQRNIQLEVRMIDALLDLTRITSGKLQLQVEALELPSEVRKAADLCTADAQAKSIGVKLDLPDNGQTLLGDSGKLQQVFANLLKNAIKFSPAHAAVTLRSSCAGDGWLAVEVIDAGIGIAPEALAHVFDPYEQGGAATTQRFGGLGLGLAICKGIVDAHGGTIAAASAGPGRGTTVSVRLPAADVVPEPPPVVPPPSPSPQALRAGLDILLVEDHEDSLRAMCRLLRKLDHRVTTATTVADALEIAGAQAFDLLISDVGLPDGTGLQLIRQLLARGPVKGIALTGYGTETDVQEATDAGFQKHLTKPIQFDELEAAIREIA